MSKDIFDIQDITSDRRRLEQAILEKRQDLSVDKIEDLAADIMDYWIGECLDDALEATEI